MYGKSDKWVFNPQYNELLERTMKKFNLKDANGEPYQLRGMQDTNNFRFEGDYRTFNGKAYKNKPGMGWKWTQEALDKRQKEDYIIEETPGGSLGYRDYLKDSKGALINTLWDDIQLSSSVVGLYNTQKPKRLIERIVKASSDPGDLVADFYAGSFTTAEVCKDLGRDFIGCDISIEGCKKGIERIGGGEIISL
jgi:DNA modification methylase